MNNKQNTTKIHTEKIKKTNLRSPHSPSRFSRRKFIHTATATSPILFSLKSPVAWGTWNDTSKTSLKILVSEYNSHPDTAWCEPKCKKYWKKCFNGQNQPVKKALDRLNCNEYTKFLRSCLVDQMDEYRCNYAIDDKWEFKLDDNCDPDLYDALDDRCHELKVQFRKRRRNGRYRTKEVNIICHNSDFFANLACAFINCKFHPRPIDYHDLAYIKEKLYYACEEAINAILMDLKNLDPLEIDPNKYAIILAKFATDIKKWQEES